MQRSPAEPKPAETAASAAASDVGVGQHHHVVLGPAEGLDPLAVPGPRLVDVAGDRRAAHERDGGDVRDASRSASTATASPCTTLSTPSGTPASWASSARSSEGDGSFSEGLSTNAFPQAMALASIQSGHHDREIERGDAGHHAERLEDRVHVDAARDLGRVRALQQMGDAAGELDVLEARGPPRRPRRSAPCRARP